MLPLFSIFVLLASGYLAKRTKVIPQNQLIVFIDFVLVFALPALIFDKVYHVNIDFHLFSVIACGLGANFAAMLIAFSLGRLLGFSKATTASMALLSMFGNTLFMGLPVLQGILGEDIVNEVILYDQMITCVPIALLGPFILSYAAPSNVSLIANAFKIMKFPPFLALVAGLLAKNLEIPDFLFAPLRLFSGAVVPVALFAVGLGLGFNTVRSSYKSTALVVFLRMVVAPCFFVAFAWVFGLEFSPSYMAGLIETAM
ncbi:MAG: AEC family transporter, partial [Campylobacter sp.]|nr:AEC family transporter [Campylobacter sp.]